MRVDWRQTWQKLLPTFISGQHLIKPYFSTPSSTFSPLRVYLLLPSLPLFNFTFPLLSCVSLHPFLLSPLQSSVRNEVMATSHVTDEWMTLMEMSSLNCYIVRRYIATPSGVLRIYPGSLMDKAFDPTRRQW